MLLKQQQFALKRKTNMTPQDRIALRALGVEDKLRRELMRANGTIEALRQEVADLKAVLANIEQAESSEGSST